MRDELFRAIGAADLEAVRRLLAVRSDLGRLRDGSGASAIQVAAYQGQREIAQQLAAAAGTIDLAEAVVLGELEEARQQIDAGGDAQAFSQDGFPLVGLAAFFGHEAAVVLLLERGADPNVAARNAMAVRPLNSAVAGQCEPTTARAIAKRLLDAGAEANPLHAGGFSPLHVAAANGDPELVDLLIARGGDPAGESDDGRTPGDLAAERGHAALAERLRALAPGAP